jgi:hypothetical protein
MEQAETFSILPGIWHSAALSLGIMLRFRLKAVTYSQAIQVIQSYAHRKVVWEIRFCNYLFSDEA